MAYSYAQRFNQFDSYLLIFETIKKAANESTPLIQPIRITGQCRSVLFEASSTSLLRGKTCETLLSKEDNRCSNAAVAAVASLYC